MAWRAPEQTALFDAIDATWTPKSRRQVDGWTIREGAGAGSRVSAASLDGRYIGPNGGIGSALRAMRALGQAPLFMIRPGDEDLDAHLHERGFTIASPVVMLGAPAEAVAAPAGLGAIPCDTTLAVQKEIWALGGIGPERLAVMTRVAGPKTALLGRSKDRPTGTAFVAVSEGIAMMHALEVRADARRTGAGRTLVTGGADWAMRHGADCFVVLVTRDNRAAIALYEGLGLVQIGAYHYRAGR